jgi:hypothetical protein
MFFSYLGAGSIAANRFKNIITSGYTPVAAGGYIVYLHDGTEWKLIAHEQGAYIDVAYNSGDFTAQSGTVTWTVDSGDMVTNAYYVKGNQVFFKLKILTSTLSPGANFLDVVIPYICARSEYTNICWGSDGAYILLFPEFDTTHNTVVRFYKFNNTAWNAGAGTHLSLAHNYITS